MALHAKATNRTSLTAFFVRAQETAAATIDEMRVLSVRRFDFLEALH